MGGSGSRRYRVADGPAGLADRAHRHPPRCPCAGTRPAVRRHRSHHIGGSVHDGGTDTFTYAAGDATGTSEPATVTITVTAATCDTVPPPGSRVGSAGNNIFNGSAGDDLLYGLGGNDVINGRGGGDLICGGTGNDALFGGDGNDRIFGRAGNDAVQGEGGDDTLAGGDGNDALSGGPRHQHRRRRAWYRCVPQPQHRARLPLTGRTPARLRRSGG